MKRFFFITVCLFMAMSSQSSSKGWTKLFNGKDFEGFRQLNGEAPYKVVKGSIVGYSKSGTPNSFLATEKDYDDFILEYDVKCDPALNSGVQFRSLSLPEYNNGRVHGYQAEIDPSDRAWSGGIYDEARRGWLVTLLNNPAGQKAYKRNGWNHYRIECLGKIIRIWLNGVNTANLLDDLTPSGFIAFQVHAESAENEGKTIEWKNIRILTTDVEKNLKKGKLTEEVNCIPNYLSDTEKAEGWTLLFDGKTSAGWRGAHKSAFPQSGWIVGDGVIKTDSIKSTHGGDIVTDGVYSAFELKVEFLITKGANSGIKYFVIESEKNRGFTFGLEYQVLDDANHPDAKLSTTFPGSRRCAGLYDLIKPEHIRFNGVGQWNQAIIKVFPNNHVEHWLNGFKTLEYERGSEAFRELVKGSKFADPSYNAYGPFGEAKEGRILLQDHGDEVSFRNIKIKILK